MKKISKYLLLLLVILVLVIIPVSARAGGGGGGSGGSGGGGSHHSSSSSNTYNPITSVVAISMIIGVFYMLKYSKIRKMNKETKSNLKNAYDKDDFWSERELKGKVKEVYFIIQKAWSKQDLDTLKLYLTDRLYQQWSIKIEWQKYRHEQNVLTHLRLLSKDLILLNDDEDDTKDYFWVAIEGYMHDSTVVDDEVVNFNNETFIEYWKFVRNDNSILLDDILQENQIDEVS